MRQTAPAYAVLALDKRLDGLKLSDGSQLSTGNMRLTPQQVDSAKGYVLLWDGSQRQMLDTYRDMTGALGISIVFIFLILVAYYQSISIPIVGDGRHSFGLSWGISGTLANAGTVFGNVNDRCYCPSRCGDT
jgi:hypothetical protein